MEVPTSSLCLSGALAVLCQRLCGASTAFLRRILGTVAVNFWLLLSEPLRLFLGIDQASFELCCIGTGAPIQSSSAVAYVFKRLRASKSHAGVARVAYAYIKVSFYILILSVAKYFQ